MNIYQKYPLGDKYKFIQNPLWYYKRYIWYPLDNLYLDLKSYFNPDRPVWFCTEDGERYFIPVSETHGMSKSQIVKWIMILSGVDPEDFSMEPTDQLEERLTKQVSIIRFDDNYILPAYTRKIECWVLDLT